MKLLNVKNILSIIVGIVFAIKALNGSLENADVIMVVVLVFQFFFNYQNNKNELDKTKKGE